MGFNVGFSSVDFADRSIERGGDMFQTWHCAGIVAHIDEGFAHR